MNTLSFFAIGFVVASLARTARTAQILGMLLYSPNIFLSGATVPQQIFPAAMRSITQAFPMTHVVRLLQGLWIGDP